MTASTVPDAKKPVRGLGELVGAIYDIVSTMPATRIDLTPLEDEEFLLLYAAANNLRDVYERLKALDLLEVCGLDTNFRFADLLAEVDEQIETRLELAEFLKSMEQP